MADEGLLVESQTKKKPKKTKPKSAKATEDDIPLADMAGTSSKFNKLLQDAVSQSVGEAKSQKKKKKKVDSSTKDSVLESLRKGEGIQKETDATIEANIYDPDHTKYEKSNTKKQKLREEQRNEVEIVDETLGKTKKKMKQKLKGDKFDSYDISQIADKTMTISELDVSRTPGKKKKKKVESEQIGSARSEEEPSVSESITTKKKKKKPVAGEPVQETIESTRTEDSYTAPVKKKKKKPVGQEQEPDTWRSEEDVTTPKSVDGLETPKKKKKKKPVSQEQEPDTWRSEEEVTTPKSVDGLETPKKKKKKKPAGGETEDEALSPSEDIVSPKGKKKKKKTPVSEEERPLSPETPVTSPGRGKKKKKKTEGETEDEALSPSEDVASPRGKGKKKKKKPATDGEEEEIKEDTEVKTEEEEPKPKPRRKKKKQTEEEPATEEPVPQEEEVPSGMDVEDDGRIMAVTIHRTDKLKNDFYIMHPMVRVHILDQDTGKYLVKQHKDRAVTAFFETQNENVTHVLPIMTKPFDFKQQKSVLPVWEELLIFNENYNFFIQERPKVIIIFELLDFVSMKRTAQNDDHESGWHKIAWAFLKVVGNNKKINTGSKVRLQLFEPPSGIRQNPDVVEQFQWWQSGNRKPYASTLYVTLKGITPPDTVEPAERSLFATQAEIGKMTYEDLKKSSNWGGKKDTTTQRAMASWSRLAGQLCRLPNTYSNALPSAKKGCFIVKFSHDGRSLACACHGKEGWPILVYEIPSGRLRGKFLGHFGIVYDMSWSKMDTHLLSASSDGTARVWNLNDFGEQAEKLLPHPAFVYCSQFHPRIDTIVVTGGYDQVIRIWDISGEEPHGDLRQELEDHIGYVNSLCFSDDGQKLYTADSIGVVLVWNSFYTEQPSKRGIARDWTLYCKLEDPEIKGTAINFITLHPSGRRLLVHCRDNIIRMLDLRVQRVMQKYIGALNFREQIRSCITPCGSFVFSGSEDNYAYAWNTDTGDQVVMYSDLKYQNPVTDVDYHPRDHMIAFCSLGENHPVLLYSYDVQVAQFDAGLSPRMISPTPADEDKEGTPRISDELASKGVLTKEEFQLHTTQRFDKVMRTLNKVTSQLTTTSTLDIPGMASTSPRLSRTGMLTMSSGYDMTPRSMMMSPTAFSPHAPSSMSAVMQQQQFASQNLYMKNVDTWRPTFSEVGRYGTTRSTSPVLGRAPQLNLTASHGKAQFNFQAPPGKAIPKYDKVVVLYDYRAQRSDELNLFAGDEVSVLYKDTDNWWMGELPDGQQGFFPANYVAEEDSLMDTHKTNVTQDDSDNESKNLTAVRTKSGELRFISGAEESEDDILESNRTRRKKKPSSLDNESNNGKNGFVKKPPRKTGQKVRISEDTESHA